MRVRATMLLRNDVLIAKRETLGMTQKDAAELCGVSVHAYQAAERMDFKYPATQNAAEIISAMFEIPIDRIMPKSLAGKTVMSKAIQVANIRPDRLLAGPNPTRLILPSPADQAEVVEATEALHLAMKSRLTYREREALKMLRGLDGQEPLTLGEAGRALKVGRERVRQLVAKAERKLSDTRRDNPLAPFIRDELEGKR